VNAAPRAARWLGIALLSSVALLPLLPLLAHSWPLLRPLERLAAVWFDFHCERDPARTPSLAGVAFGVCARCSGIYFGLGLGAFVRRPRLTPVALRSWVALAAAFMLADVTLERWGLHGSWTAVRTATGLLLAYPVGVGLATAIARAPVAIQSP
jgi:uncharacterized membrane protein